MDRGGIIRTHDAHAAGPRRRGVAGVIGTFLIVATAVVSASSVGVPGAAAAITLPVAMTPANGGTTGTAGSGAFVGTPGTGRTVITVKSGGDRGNTDGTPNPNNILALSGVQYAAYPQAADPSTLPLPDTTGSFVAWCTTDATGLCWMNVPQNGATGYTVVEISPPTNWQIIETLNIGGQINPGTNSPYRFHVSGSTAAQAAPPTGTGSRVSSGTWATRRTNPPLGAQCGLNVGMLVDLSSSVGSGNIGSIRTALTTTINLLNGTGSQMAIHTFGSTSPADSPTESTANSNLGLTPVSGTGFTTLTNKANALTVTGIGTQYTNWDRGLYSFANDAANLDVVIMLTDGMPTAYGTTIFGTNRFIEVEEAVASANYLKSKNTRIISVGIGNGAAGQAASNLQSISGPTLNSDYFQVANFAALADELANLVQAACAGVVSVTKNVIPLGGGTPVPTPGWQITGTAAASILMVDGSGDAFANSAAGTTNAAGAVPFRVDFTNSGASKVLTFTETQQANFTPVTYPDGKLAECRATNNPGTLLPVTNVPNDTAPTAFQVTALAGLTVACTIQNQAEATQADLRVNKLWRIDADGDGTYEEVTAPNVPPTSLQVSAALQLTGNVAVPTSPQFGIVYTGFAINSTVNIAETLIGLPPLCTNTATYAPTLDAGGLFTLSQGSNIGPNEVTITNSITCQTKLTLAKSVPLPGTAAPTEWVLDAIQGAGATLPGPNGVTGSTGATADVTPAGVYALAEAPSAAVEGQYLQDWNPTIQEEWTERHDLGSTGSWVCVSATSVVAGVPTFGTNQVDGRNGGVQVPAGDWRQCTATNRPLPTIQLVKELSINGQVTTVPVGDTRWTLTAGGWTSTYSDGTLAMITPNPYGTQADVSGPGGYAATPVLPGIYTLSESAAPSGYTNGTTWTCTVDGQQFPITNSQITLLAGNNAVCTIRNTAIQPTLTLFKNVVDLDGAQSLSALWTLTATSTVNGATPINGKPLVAANGIRADVLSGVTYTLSESDGPTGYTAGTIWVCAGGTFTGTNQITLAPGENGSCTITNALDFKPLTVAKTASGTYHRTYEWSITKAVDQTSITTTPDGKAIFNYTVTATPEGSTDSEWAITGVVTVTNANNVDVPITLTDEPAFVGPDATCAFTVGASVTVPANDSQDYAYSCTLGSAPPDYFDARNIATAIWTRNGGGAASGTADFDFAIGAETNKTITVEDNKTTGTYVSLGTVTWNEDHFTTPFTYSVTQPGGAAGTCATYNNTAQIVETQQSANQSVQVCVPGNPTITKSAVGVAAAAGGTWDVTYTVDVTNPATNAQPITYSLSDTPGFPPGVTINSAAATFGGAPVGAWNGTSITGMATDKSLAVGVTDTYTVVVNATITASALPDLVRCDEGGPGHGFFNAATATSNGADFTASDCIEIPRVPRWTIAKSATPASGTPVDTIGAGNDNHTITYTLTAKNPSLATVEGAVAVDTLPANVTVDGALPAGLAAGPGAGQITWTIPTMAPGGTATVSFPVIVNDGAGGADGTTPLVNTVAPTTTNGSCEGPGMCETTHPVKRLIASTAPACVSDAAFVAFNFSTLNVPDAGSLPTTVTWRTQDGTVARVDTIPAGQTSGQLLWPGMVLNADGIAVGWPGWRDLQPSDFPLAPGAQIYGTQIQDPSIPSYAYRLPMTVTFSINPSETLPVLYPDVTPQGCAVLRDPALSIVKSASTSTVTPGEAFTYSIAVANISTLGVAYPVTLTDPISSALRITDITTSTTDFPRWVNCAITGADGEGYGGTLNCELNGALGVSSMAPLVTLTAVPRATAAPGTIANTATVCWSNPSDTSQPQQCAPSTVNVSLPVVPVPPDGGDLPATGAQIMSTAALAAATFGLGWFLLVAVRRRRRRLA